MLTLSKPEAAKRSRPREKEVDILRAAALLYVIGFWHLSEYVEPNGALDFLKSSFVTYTVLGLFCFISGYLLSKQTAIANLQQALHFYQKRLIRIYPMYLLTLTAFLLVGFIGVKSFLKSLFATNMIYYEPVMTLWFVSLILTLYALFPLYVYRYRPQWAIVLTLSLCSAFWLIATSGLPWIDHRLAVYLPLFVFGIVVGKHAQVYTFMGRPGVQVLCAGVLLGLIVVDKVTAPAAPVQFALIYCGMGVSIPAFYGLARGLARLNFPGVLHFLSYSSFAAYLIHRLTFHLGTLVYQPTGLRGSLVYLVGVLLPLTLVLGYGFQHFFDTKVKDVVSKLRAPALN